MVVVVLAGGYTDRRQKLANVTGYILPKVPMTRIVFVEQEGSVPRETKPVDYTGHRCTSCFMRLHEYQREGGLAGHVEEVIPNPGEEVPGGDVPGVTESIEITWNGTNWFEICYWSKVQEQYGESDDCAEQQHRPKLEKR